MSILPNSSVKEDRYIAYLAGQKGGQKIIGKTDEPDVFKAQEPPISNRIASVLNGSLSGISATLLGLLVYPFINGDTRETIIGSSKFSICTSCGIHLKNLSGFLLQFPEFSPTKKALSYLDQQFTSFSAGIVTVLKCSDKEDLFNACRLMNYLGAIKDVLSNYPLIIGVGTIFLAVLYTSDAKNSFISDEKKAECGLINTLAARFEKIAERLTDREADPKIQECAKMILTRRLEINDELENLQLPNLKRIDIRNITQPVFDAAKEVMRKSKPDTAHSS